MTQNHLPTPRSFVTYKEFTATLALERRSEDTSNAHNQPICVIPRNNKRQERDSPRESRADVPPAKEFSAVYALISVHGGLHQNFD